MSVIFMDGFDMYNGANAGTGIPAKWTIPAGNVGTAGGRFGGQALNLNSSNGGDISCRTVFNGAGNTTALALGFAFQVGTLRNDTLFDVLSAALGIQFGIGYTAAGALTVYNGSTTFLTSAAGLITTGVWYYCEAEVTLNATGAVNLYLGGVSIGTATGVNTGTGAGVLQARALGGGFVNHYYDDVYITNTAAKLGECKVETLRPSADSSVAWTPNSGSNNYSRVNETLVDGDTSFVQTATLNTRDLYANPGLSSTPSSVMAVNVVSFAEKTDATARALYNSVRSGATDSDGASASLTSSYLRYDRILNSDPNTSAPWTPSGVNNLLFGPKAA